MTESEMRRRLGQALKDLRLSKNKNRSVVAEVSPFSRSGITKLESEISNPQIIWLAMHVRSLKGPKLSTVLKRIGL